MKSDCYTSLAIYEDMLCRYVHLRDLLCNRKQTIKRHSRHFEKYFTSQARKGKCVNGAIKIVKMLLSDELKPTDMINQLFETRLDIKYVFQSVYSCAQDLHLQRESKLRLGRAI
jgi:hypothetical protein